MNYIIQIRKNQQPKQRTPRKYGQLENRTIRTGKCMSYKEICMRLHQKDEFYFFFVHVNQRLLPDMQALKPGYFRQLLNGEKEALRLLDCRDYYFPHAYRNERALSAARLYQIWFGHEVLSRYVPDPCMDQAYMIKIMASLDYDLVVRLDEEILKQRSGNSHLNGHIADMEVEL